jgi:hypothetical protein
MSRTLKRIQWVLRASTRPPHKERYETRRDRTAGDERLPALERESVSDASFGRRLAYALRDSPLKPSSSSSFEG